jgi:TP901 family phage tail tape measure protein
MAKQVASLFGVLKLDDSDYRNKLNQAQTNTQSFGQQLRNLGQNLQNMGAGMTALFAPVGVAMGYAITQGHTFDRTFSNINSILKLGAEDAAALRAQILAYGSTTVAGPQATAEAYYEIVSGVADATTHMAILEAATRTAEAGQADLGATTSALISTMNAYQLKAEDAAHVSDVFSRTVGMGVLTMDELAAAFPQVTGLGAQFNVSIDELGAGMAYLTAQGYSAAQSATFMRSMMTTLLNPTEELQAAITALGYESGAALLEAEGLTGAYELLAAQNGGLDGLITNTEALQGALVLTGDGADEFFTTYTEGIDGATAAAGSIQDQTEQWNLLKSALDGVAIQLSDALMPTLNNLVTNYVMPVVTAVSGWMAQNPELTTQIALLVGGLVILGPILTAIGAGITFLISPIGLVIAGIALFAAAYYTNFGGIKDFIDTTVIPGFQSMIDKAVEIWTFVEPYLTNFYNWFMVDALPAVKGYLDEHIFPLIENFTGLISDIWTLTEPHLQKLYEWFMVTALPAINDWINNTFMPTITAIGANITGFIDHINDAIDTIRTFLGVSGEIDTSIVPAGSSSSSSSLANGDAVWAGGNADGTGYAPAGVPMEWQEPKSGGEIFIPRVTGSVLNAQQQFAAGMMSGMSLGGQRGGDTYQITAHINANTDEGGRAAARGFDAEFGEIMRSRGIQLQGT